MKKIIAILIFAFLTNSIYSQELPEITTKNGIAYYVFQHKLDNTKKCLSYYFEPKGSNLPIGSKLTQLCIQFQTNKNKLGKQGVSIYSMAGFIQGLYHQENLHEYAKLNCEDTIIGESVVPSLDVTLNGEIAWSPGFIDLVRKKIMSQKLTAKIDVIFLSKNEYKLVVKDIVYRVFWIRGTNQDNDYYNLGEYYEQVKNSGSIGKNEIKFFEFIDMLIKSADEIILKTLTDTYLADEI